MRLWIVGVAMLLSGAAPAAARADSFFNLSGTLQDGGMFSGKLDVSTQGEAHVQGTVTDGAYSFTLPPNYLGEQLDEGNYVDVSVFAVNAQFELDLLFTNAVFANGGPLCSLTNYCPGTSTSFFSNSPGPDDDRFLSLTSTPTSVTPEPGTLLLLGTGLLRLVGVGRRRLER